MSDLYLGASRHPARVPPATTREQDLTVGGAFLEGVHAGNNLSMWLGTDVGVGTLFGMLQVSGLLPEWFPQGFMRYTPGDDRLPWLVRVAHASPAARFVLDDVVEALVARNPLLSLSIEEANRKWREKTALKFKESRGLA